MTLGINSIDKLLHNGVRDNVYPGAVWAIGDAAGTKANGAVGCLDPMQPDHPMRLDTIFDVASLAKILAVWASIGTLVEDGKLQLDQSLGGFWSEVEGRPLGQVTAHHLLTHTACLPLRANLKNLYGTDAQDIRDGVLHEALHRPPGEVVVKYTDRAALILGYLAEHISGQRLDQLARTRIWRSLGMAETSFGPLPTQPAKRCPPTEMNEANGLHLKGTTHGFSARLLDGICGIAGVFSLLQSLASFLRRMLDPMAAPEQPGFSPDWVTESLQIHTGEERQSGACSGTQPPARIRHQTTSGCTTASPALACGSHRRKAAG
ncbi:Beta-lactamase [Streptomyces yunnanensis]|uniref:Beta-lactamase n=1 Tax=Streptomyces yunnanensis TaxID=156453 RepID=A0A9X8N9L0_9ACTN|nr:Beta-lactamase [Streptomyces yunnanensis]